MSAVWRIEGELDIYHAAELKAGLAAALAAEGPVEVDLGAVTEMDGAGVQLLLLARRMAARRGVPLHLVPGPVADEVLRRLGLDAEFRPAGTP